MVKYKTLQQHLIKASLIAVITVSLLGSACYALYSWSESLTMDHRRVQTALRSTRGDIATRQQKADDAEKYMGLYQTIIGTSEQNKLAELNREKAQDWISGAASELELSDLDGVFDPVVNIESSAFRKKTLQGVASKVGLRFGAMTDEQLLRFLEAVIVDFPGYVKVEKVVLEKKGDIDDAVLMAAGRGKFAELVTGQLEFNWIAVKKIPQNAAGETPQEYHP